MNPSNPLAGPADAVTRVYSLAVAAGVLGVSTRTLTREIAAGRIKSVKVSPNRRVVPAEEISRVLGGATA